MASTIHSVARVIVDVGTVLFLTLLVHRTVGIYMEILTTKSAIIVYSNAPALPMYQLLIYRSSTQRTAPQVHLFAVPQCSSRRRDGNTTTATYCNAAAVDYERNFKIDS